MFFVLLSSPFFGGRKPGERLKINHARPPIEQAHILARPNKTPEFNMSDMTVLSTKNRRVLWQMSVDSVDEEKKSPKKAGNESFGK